MFCEVLLNKLLVPDLIDEVLTVVDETEGCHDVGEVEDCEEDGE